jgi:hypothetical protein
MFTLKIRLLLFLTIASTVPALPVSADELSTLIAHREQLETTVWQQETLAQEHEEFFIRLWDELRNNRQPLATLSSRRFERIEFGKLSEPSELEHGIHVSTMGNDKQTMTREEWVKWIQALSASGFDLEQSEWHHKKFQKVGNAPGYSTVSFSLHVHNLKSSKRIILDGLLNVQWELEKGSDGVYDPELISVTSLEVLSRQGQPLFARLGAFDIEPTRRGPVLAYDLNNDGASELILPGASLVAWNDGTGDFSLTQLNAIPIVNARAAVIGDFDRDARPDLVIDGSIQESQFSQKKVGLFLFRGGADGRFLTAPEQLIIEPEFKVRGDTTLTAGDIDGDGDLDLWLGQYKEPYVSGSMPTPFFDSNDGHPSFLLINSGDGIRFTEETEKRGIGPKRHRRVYSSSFWDYDNDLDQDLLVVSDFSGVDLYRNNGQGHFTDVTESAIPNRYLFGMAHSIADFNRDGLLDFYAIGMSSTTASRLHAMGARREDLEELTDMRIPMTFGNRLYFGQGDGEFIQPDMSKYVARTGWAWGVATADFDNDGDLDFYVANGHDSNTTARDYCTSYWTDDIYRGGSSEDSLMSDYFELKLLEKEAKGISWNPFEHNFLYLPMSDGRIRNVSYLAGVALEEDSRMVVADDLNGDGRLDLIVDSNPPNWDQQKDGNLLTVFLNNFRDAGNFVGVILQERKGGPVSTGARVDIAVGGRVQTSANINGDSFEAQHPATKHFGLGTAESVDFIEVTWTDGTRQRINNPAINKYHTIAP